MIGIFLLLYNKVIDADCKSAEYKRLGHFLMPDCKSGRTPNGYQITTESNPAGRLTGEIKNPQATFLCQIMHIV